jgi:hypothetical protein
VWCFDLRRCAAGAGVVFYSMLRSALLEVSKYPLLFAVGVSQRLVLEGNEYHFGFGWSIRACPFWYQPPLYLVGWLH